ncbi:putative bifunctional diguanylate cyclase/phosphodiesterase [Planomonospora parontospora]|uniref:putative bifunctional diguanylate cyclase/phosphodiesterase n=1 Tax=Planomonospora parontospora TaxID=58119 RepID=UPI00167032F1|nr:EAL domain-containing protein [Planomonospora parontospora]
MLSALALLAVFGLAWFAVTLAHPAVWPVVAWVPVVLSSALATFACVRVHRSTPAGAVRTFWRHLGVSMGLVTGGLMSNAHTALTAPEATRYIGAPALALYLGALLTAIWALLRLPLGRRSRKAYLTLGLDAGIVMLAAALFTWYLMLRTAPYLLTAGNTSWSVLLIVALGFLEVLAAVKVMLAGAGPLHRSVLIALGMAFVAAATCGALSPLSEGRPDVNVIHFSLPIIVFFVALAAERQRQVAARPVPAPRRRPFSLLPYGAIAAADALLLFSAQRPGPEIRVIAAATIALTALVVIRQVVAFRDNADLHRQLAHQATHDTLTQLANRALFAERTAEALADTGLRGSALALIDLDDFKAVNDRLGHAVGDTLLVAVAHRLRACVRRGDTVARLGGDEFAVLLLDVTVAEAEQIVERIIQALRTPVSADGHELLVQASVGLVDSPQGAAGASELLRRADVAMYTAKEQGKSRYVRYSPDLDARALEHARLETEMRRALEGDELFLLYQPVVTLPGGELSGVEALVRWRHPERGLVSPAEFVPVAERTGMIVELGAWVLREACRQMADWKHRYGPAAPVKMSVNVSARQLRDRSFAETVAEALAETGLRPADLVMEITETSVFDGGLAVETVQAVQELGVAIALDDFGTGHSSLGLLRTCPVDVLKVDKLFIDGVTGTTEQAAIATSLPHIARALRLSTVAEGVETAAQAERLHELGYRLAQGFHFAPPLSPGNIEQILKTRRADLGADSWEPSVLAG